MLSELHVNSSGQPVIAEGEFEQAVAGFLDSVLDGGGIIGDAVSFGTEGSHVTNTGHSRKCR